MISLQESAAIVTGASSGIGKAVSAALAAKGARVAMLARNTERLKATSSEVGGLALKCDVREAAEVEAAVETAASEFGRIDILINAAGLSLNGPVDGYSNADWDTVIGTNLSGTFYTCRAVLPYMKRQKWGQIVNVASGAGRNGIRDMAAYCASKFGVIGFTESLALEVRDENIRVASLLPGSVATSFGRIARREASGPASGDTNAGYSLLPAEVAEVLLSMLSQPEQAWMSEVVLRPLNLTLKRNQEGALI